MTIERIIDGTVYEFPEGTPPAVIKRFELSKAAPTQNPGAPTQPSAARATSDTKPFLPNALGAGLQGLSMGFSDEAIARMRSMMDRRPQNKALSSLITGKPQPGSYEDYLQAERSGLHKYSEENPVTSGVAELAGGLAPALVTGGAGAIPAVARTAPRLAGMLAGSSPSILRMMGMGAGQGAITAAGTSEKPLGDMPSEMVMGAGAGAVTAGGLGLAGRYVAMPAFRYLKNVMGFGDKNQMADLAVAKALAKDGLTPEQAATKIAAMQRGEMTIADLGENTAALLRKVTAAPGETRNVARAELVTREAGRVPRVSEDMRSLMSGSKDFYTDVQDLMRKRSQDAESLYEAAYSTGPIFDAMNAPNINTLRNLPSFKEAMRSGQKRMADLNLDITDPKNTLRALHETKLALDDMIESKVRAGEGNQARTLIDMRDRMLKDMERASPEYGIARQTYAGDSEMLSAMNEGTRIYQMPEMELRKLVKRFEDSPSEMDAWRSGVSQAMLEKLRTAGPSANPLTSVLGRDAENKLRRAFRDDEAFDLFKNRMLEESRMLQTEKAGFRKTAEDVDLSGPSGAVSALGTLATGNPVAAVTQGLAAAVPRAMGVNPGMSRMAGQKLLTPATSLDPVMGSIMQSLKAEEQSLRGQSMFANAAAAGAGAMTSARPAREQPVPGMPSEAASTP